MKNYNPAQDGIDAVKHMVKAEAKVDRMIAELKDFIIESMRDGSVDMSNDMTDAQVLEIIKDGVDLYYNLAVDQIGED